MSHPRPIVTAFACSLIMMTACSSGTEPLLPDGSTSLTERSPTPAANFLGICGGNYYDVDPTCNGQNARIGFIPGGVGGGAPGTQETIAAAIAPWQELLWQGELVGVPQVFSGSQSKTITVHFPGVAGDVCGITPNDPGGGISRILLIAAANCGSIQTGPVAVVLRHEVTHVLGWEGGEHGGAIPRNSAITGAATGRCTTFIPANASLGPIPANVCYHEVEAINRAHTTGFPSSQVDMFTQEMLTRTDASPRVLSLAIGVSATIAAPHWVSWPSNQAVSKAQFDLGWSVSPSSVATVSGIGVVTGAQAGTGKVLLRAQSAPPAGYALWTPFELRGDSVALTVTTPPPVLLQVSDVVVRDASTNAEVTLPITTAGTYAIDAVVVGSPTWTMLQWSVVDSRTPSISLVDSTWAPTFTAYAGDSYNRRFTILPFSGGTSGIYHIRDIPICVTAGGNNLVASKKSSGTGWPVTNAVGGC